MTGPDPFQHFLDAQAVVYPQVLAELAAGRKYSHWMWFIFPQLSGLGKSATSRRFALASSQQALEYYDHPVLGPRLRECCRVLLDGGQDDARVIFGSLDALKLRSSMTLFSCAAPKCTECGAVLDRFFAGQPDPVTLKLLDPP